MENAAFQLTCRAAVSPDFIASTAKASRLASSPKTADAAPTFGFSLPVLCALALEATGGESVAIKTLGEPACCGAVPVGSQLAELELSRTSAAKRVPASGCGSDPPPRNSTAEQSVRTSAAVSRSDGRPLYVIRPVASFCTAAARQKPVLVVSSVSRSL